MRKSRLMLLAASLSVAFSSVVIAAIDLSDFNDDVMRAMDDSIKDLEPSLGAGNTEAAKNDLDVLVEAYQWTEDYFVKKGNADDAVKIAQQGKLLVAAVDKAMVANNLTDAASAARGTAKNCKSCHDLYKPLTK